MAELAKTRNIADLLQTSQQKAISTGLLTLVLVTVLLWGSFRPTLLTILETNTKFQEKTDILNRLETQNTRLTELLSKQAELSKEINALDHYFPSNGDYSLFITNLNSIAEKNNLKLNSVSFSASYFRQVANNVNLQYPEMTPTTFQVAITGDPANLPVFLSFLEGTPFMPKILSIGYSPNRSNPLKTTMSVTLLLYKMTARAPVFNE